ncbi:MAG: VWA domain-containing protein [Candidatus Binatia bacterium]
MITVQYTEWDGSQRVRLAADKIFEELAKHLSSTDDLQQAMESLMRQGLEEEDKKLKGLDDLVRDLREEMRKRYREYNLRSSLDEVQQKLENILKQEKKTLQDRRPQNPDLTEKEQFLKQLPQRLSEQMEKLSQYDFEDAAAQQAFDELMEEFNSIRSVEDFQRRYKDLFNGPQSLDFQQTLELMDEMQQLQEMEQNLLAGRSEKIDPNDLQELMGQGAWQDLQNLQQMQSMLEEAGLLVYREGRVALSPKGVRRIGQLALRDIYANLLRDRSGPHTTDHRGAAEIRMDETRPYSYGDPMHLDLVGTMKKSLRRTVGVPIKISPEDFTVYDTDHLTTSSTVLLLDMSWSMSWEGRFAAAKKVALALESLIRTRYPRDYFSVVGFFTRAVELKIKDLPEASWNMGDPFTNLQDGIRLASDLLHRHPGQNQNIIVVTDGQPTAYFSRGRLYCEWPLSFGGISMRAAQETLKEVERATQRHITINTFMLDDSPSLRSFVDRMTQLNRGRAFYTRPDHLGEYLLIDYVSKKKKRI